MKQPGSTRWARALLITIVLAAGTVAPKPLRGQNLQVSVEDRLTRLEAKMASLEESNRNNLTFLQIIVAIGTIVGSSWVLTGFGKLHDLRRLGRNLSASLTHTNRRTVKSGIARSRRTMN